jgi:beta-lactamase regulating signal transducer with metallopeptidase domain
MNMETLSNAVGWTLIHSLWQGAIIAGGVLIVVTRLRSPQARYAFYCAGMAALPLVIALTFAARIKSSTPFISDSNAIQFAGEIRRAGVGANPGNVLSGNRGDWNQAVGTLAWIWIAGVAVMSLRAAGAGLGVRRLRRDAAPCDHSEWERKLNEWSRELRIAKPIRLCVMTLNDVPAVIGHFKPIILLPAAILTRMSNEQIEALILHELMHIRRNDFLVNALQVICETLLFFNPTAWWLSRAIREERENCCDDAVARFSGRRAEYARALLSLEETRAFRCEPLAVGAHGGSLKKRIARLLSPESAPIGAGSGAVSLLAIVFIAAVVCFCWPQVNAQLSAERARKPAGDTKAEAKVITVELQSYFIVMNDDPAKQFSLGNVLKRVGTTTSWTLSSVDARRILTKGQQNKEIELLSAPAITTLSGRAARIEMGEVPPSKGEKFGPNARGYVKIKDPKPDAEPALIGQSLEILPVIRKGEISLRGKFQDAQKVSRDGKEAIEKRFSGAIDVEISRNQALAMTLPSATDPKKFLLLVVIPVVTDW